MTVPGPGWWARRSAQHQLFEEALQRDKEARIRNPRQPREPRKPKEPEVLVYSTLPSGQVVAFNRASGLLYRPDTNDLSVISEIREYAGLLAELQPDDVVLDLGANIGVMTFTMLQKVARVIAVEPEPGNLEVLYANRDALDKYGRVDILECAATQETGDRDFWINTGKGKSMHSIEFRRGRTKTTVHGVAFSDIIEEWKPTVIKCDIEGGEYELVPTFASLPAFVRAVGLELHLMNKEWRATGAVEFDRMMRAQGFDTPKQPPKLGTSWSGTTAAYVR